jgi:hypothetical protein
MIQKRFREIYHDKALMLGGIAGGALPKGARCKKVCKKPRTYVVKRKLASETGPKKIKSKKPKAKKEKKAVKAKGSGMHKANTWVEFLKAYSASRGIGYKEALMAAKDGGLASAYAEWLR